MENTNNQKALTWINKYRGPRSSNIDYDFEFDQLMNNFEIDFSTVQMKLRNLSLTD